MPIFTRKIPSRRKLRRSKNNNRNKNKKGQIALGHHQSSLFVCLENLPLPSSRLEKPQFSPGSRKIKILEIVFRAHPISSAQEPHTLFFALSSDLLTVGTIYQYLHIYIYRSIYLSISTLIFLWTE